MTYFDFSFILRKVEKFRDRSEFYLCASHSGLLKEGEEGVGFSHCCKAFHICESFRLVSHIPLGQGQILQSLGHKIRIMIS